MPVKHKRFLMFIVCFLIYIMAVSMGHSVYTQMQVYALEETNEYLVNELVKFHDENTTKVNELIKRAKR